MNALIYEDLAHARRREARRAAGAYRLARDPNARARWLPARSGRRRRDLDRLGRPLRA